jgi:hypothetical protein
MNLSNIARRQSNTAQNMACNLDAEVPIGVSWTYSFCALFIRLQLARLLHPTFFVVPSQTGQYRIPGPNLELSTTVLA